MRLVKSLVELGLVDRPRLMVFPLVLGENGKEPSLPIIRGCPSN